MHGDEEFSTSDIDEVSEDEDETEDSDRASRHIYLRSECGLCNQPMSGDEWALACKKDQVVSYISREQN